jgi:hypothetical protein
MANVDFVKKGTQKCAGKDMKVYVSSSTYSVMKCVKGGNGWEPEWARFKTNHICICASGQSPNIGYHLATYAERLESRHGRRLRTGGARVAGNVLVRRAMD